MNSSGTMISISIIGSSSTGLGLLGGSSGTRSLPANWNAMSDESTVWKLPS